MPANIAKFQALTALSLDATLAKKSIMQTLFALWGKREFAVADSEGSVVAHHVESGFLKPQGLFLRTHELYALAKQSLTKLVHRGEQNLQCQIIAETAEISLFRSMIDSFWRRNPKLSIMPSWHRFTDAYRDWRIDAELWKSKRTLGSLGLLDHQEAQETELALNDGFDYTAFETEFADELKPVRYNQPKSAVLP